MSHIATTITESSVSPVDDVVTAPADSIPCAGDKRSGDDTTDDQARLKRRTTEEGRPILLETHKRTQNHGRSSTQPRWHNQSYMLFLALRQHPERCLPRTELIKAALSMDKKISEERRLPKVFRGKTPMNSASAILTNNSDRYFIPFRPDGSRSMHFKLAYEPGNFTKAVQEYRKWEQKLAEHDWPYCFGVPKQKTESTTSEPMVVVTEFDTFIARRKSDQDVAANELRISQLDKENAPADDEQMAVRPVVGSQEEISRSTLEQEQLNPTATKEQLVDLNDLDLTNVPKSWTDILRVDDSKIAGAGKGLFASRRLPYNTPLGFYFGVPMTEDEFDSLKDGVGRASEYSMMYRKTVLDATNEEGYPHNNPDGEMYCPFHFMNETNEAGANMVFLEGALVNQVICWTKRDIEEGEELLVWYGRDVDRHWDSK
ncbi:hypothetical protein DFQ28_008406 [Apophysomyces sp. BC1034]|nr:hypothetical protein DFQ30_007940 [Apophysomyces sp. BC1015]KAG0181869.1 hypothetical protein DFQ29_006663 [Apophysomyces sp. BC1021]KAG0192657.1 hypothetical protein DFQ28_008406 [Apophysomyces sp. BC1034]